MSTFLIVVIGFLFSIISLKYFFIPYVLIAVCWLSLLVILTLTSKTTVTKSIWFNLAFVVFLLGALEGYSYFPLEANKIERSYSEGYRDPSETLGYAPARNKASPSKMLYENQLVYDVTYTIGNDGLRITPPARSHNDDNCIIFFGGSFTFGEGVDDSSAMPYVVGTLQRNKVHNFGFHGYGPHQMLSAIENGMVECKPSLAIYQSITAHVARSAGRSIWDQHGPKYILRNGHLVYGGHFDDQKKAGYTIKNKIINQVEKSAFYNKYIKKITNHDINLFLEIVDGSRRELVERFPEVEFHVILWDSPHDDAYLKIRDGLKQRAIKFHLISEILPGYSTDKERYKIANDGHPSAIAHKLIAEYVVQNIVSLDLAD